MVVPRRQSTSNIRRSRCGKWFSDAVLGAVVTIVSTVVCDVAPGVVEGTNGANEVVACAIAGCDVAAKEMGFVYAAPASVGVIVRLNVAVPPAVTLAEGVAAFIVKSLTANLCGNEIPPPGNGFFTTTSSVAACVMSLAGSVAWRSVALT